MQQPPLSPQQSHLLAQDFFELFSLPVAYQVDIATLTARYRELQQAVHPDRYAASSNQERRLSLQMAAHINEALQTLKDPLLRARYLLTRHGVDADQSSTALDNTFLMEQIELREQLQEIKEQQDPATAMAQLDNSLTQQLHELQQDFSRHIATPDINNLAQAHALYNKMQFLTRLREELDALQDEY